MIEFCSSEVDTGSPPIGSKRMARPVRKWLWFRWSGQSAQTYPAFRRTVGQDGDPCVLGFIKGSASSAIFQPKASRTPIDRQAIFLAPHADIGRPAKASPTELGSGRDDRRLVNSLMAQERPDSPGHLGGQRNHGCVCVRRARSPRSHCRRRVPTSDIGANRELSAPESHNRCDVGVSTGEMPCSRSPSSA
jgi:hypothetical protein